MRIVAIGEGNAQVIHKIDSDGNIQGIGVKIQTGESLIDALRRASKLNLLQTSQPLSEIPVNVVPPFEYSQRVYRPYRSLNLTNFPQYFCDADILSPPINAHAAINSARQIGTLISRLETIFDVIEPDERNVDSFGHEIRNLILVACTEVEAQAKGVLEANNVAPLRNNFSMRDYRKLLPVMLLDQYVVRMPYYPLLEARSPFANWQPYQESTGQWRTGLDWYDAYNSIKHDREGQFHESKLRHLINAVLACVVLLESQFGHNVPWTDSIQSRFNITSRPSLPLMCCEHDRSPVPNGTWTHVDFPF
ncbi:hypothetical protein [Leptothoe spongobia]|uniref:Uncharacterized protein n=1 Tax=Leptothoe spongobia TAU-MAC 1115 TaxID=1967444 RepID=A0A947DIX7_9CYAN|nr:hypothetical protein [Leptothoe spongobia]MBT9317813.1 hypothetical protein [Leptothoe spongobia TAU-MAC 1115]